MIDPDAIYEEVEMNNESDAKNTDSENEMQEVIVGEEVIEQQLDEVVLYNNTYEGRPVRRKPSTFKSQSAAIIKSPGASQSPNQQARGTRLTQALSKQTIKVTPGQRFLPVAKPIKGTILSSPMALKRKAEPSPLIVKLEGVKRTRPADNPITMRPSTTPSRPVRIVKHIEVQTDISGEVMDQYQQIIDEDQQKIALLEDQVRKLKYTPEMFENDDKRTQYFTGLETFVNMVTLFNLCEPELPAASNLTKFEIFMLTLLKLRLKLPLTFLGYMFGVSPKTANYFYNEGITILHQTMQGIFHEEVK